MSIETAIKDALREVLKEHLNQLKGTVAPAARRPTDELWPVRKAAAVAGVSPWTVRAWIREGQLRSYGRGRLIRLRRSEVLDFIDGLARVRHEKVDTEQLAREILAHVKPKR